VNKLNVGCGEKKYPDYLNIDLRPEVNPDVCMDVSDLSRFADKAFDYILAEDILEHFSHRKIWDVLTEWVRCLSVGGKLDIRVPSIDRILAKRDLLISSFGGDSSFRFSQLIFGGQNYSGNFHNVCLTREFFELAEKKLNLKIIVYNEIGEYNHQVIFEKL